MKTSAHTAVIALVFVIFGINSAFNQTYYYPQPKITVASRTDATVTINGLQNTDPGCYMEVTPWVVAGGWRSYFFTTGHTGMISDPEALSGNPYGSVHSITIDQASEGPNIVSTSLNKWLNTVYTDAQISQTEYQWRKNYHGTFSAHRYSHGTLGDIMISYTHGENKNEIKDGDSYQNTIRPFRIIDPDNPETFAGEDDNGVYTDDYDSYFGFVNLSWIPNNLSTNWGQQYPWDQGPIAWPAKGYVSTRSSLGYVKSNGLRHPSSIIVGNYVYVYFIDTSRGNEEGRESGIKVIRAKLIEAQQADKYEIYYNGTWGPSLPNGFTAQNLLNYADIEGPKSTNVINGTGTTRFSVSKVSGENYYLGVEEYMENDIVKVALRTSYDLINWSNRQVQLTNQGPGWGAGTMHYPIFLDYNGWTNTEVDVNNFFLIGANTNTAISRIRLGLNVQKSYTRIVKPFGPFFYDVNSDVTIFPNPSKGTFHINFISDIKAEKILVYDVNGKLQKEYTPSSRHLEISLQDLENGIYFINIVSEGQPLITKKVIKY